MKRFFIHAISFAMLVYPAINGQITSIEKGLSAITTDVLRAQLGFLASDWTEGREAGEKGEYMAGDYIASMLQLYGVKPGGDFPQPRGFTNFQRINGRTYFQNFILQKTFPGDENILKVRSAKGPGSETISFTYNFDFTSRPADRGIELDAPVVFAGYGFKSDKLKYNDFSKLDLKGKFVLKLMGSPGFAQEALSPSELSASAIETEALVKSMGAIGIIEINPNSETVGKMRGNIEVNLSPSESNPRSGKPYAAYTLPGESYQDNLIRIVISSNAAKVVLKGTGIDLRDFIRKSESTRSIQIPGISGKSIYFKTTVRTEAVRVRNVLGIIEGTDPDQVIVLGAHYDHLGTGNGYIWNGADDNASGTVGVMTIAKAINESGKKPAKSIIFAPNFL